MEGHLYIRAVARVRGVHTGGQAPAAHYTRCSGRSAGNSRASRASRASNALRLSPPAPRPPPRKACCCVGSNVLQSLAIRRTISSFLTTALALVSSTLGAAIPASQWCRDKHISRRAPLCARGHARAGAAPFAARGFGNFSSVSASLPSPVPVPVPVPVPAAPPGPAQPGPPQSKEARAASIDQHCPGISLSKAYSRPPLIMWPPAVPLSPYGRGGRGCARTVVGEVVDPAEVLPLGTVHDRRAHLPVKQVWSGAVRESVIFSLPLLALPEPLLSIFTVPPVPPFPLHLFSVSPPVGSTRAHTALHRIASLLCFRRCPRCPSCFQLAMAVPGLHVPRGGRRAR